MFKKTIPQLLVLSGLLVSLSLFSISLHASGVYCRGSQARLSYREIVTPFLIDKKIQIHKLTAAEAVQGRLSQMDVLLVTELGLQGENTTPVDFNDLGKKKIREYIKKGGVLDRADVIVFPGGGASNTASMLGARGLEKVRKFVQKGGGYLGYCAGAYLGPPLMNGVFIC